MHRLVTLIGGAVVVGAAAVFSNAEEEPRKSEIATFDSVLLLVRGIGAIGIRG